MDDFIETNLNLITSRGNDTVMKYCLSQRIHSLGIIVICVQA